MAFNRGYLIRLSFYLIGIVFLSFGISCSVYSQLGAAPMPSLQVGLQQTIGLTVGTWEFTIGAILVTIMAVVRRSRPDVLAFLSSLITGLGIDMWLFVVKQVWIPDQWFDKILFLCFGLIFIGLGVSLYLQAKFSPAPPDGMILLLEEIFKMNRSTSRTLFSGGVVTISFIFGGPIGVGTIIMVISLGPVVSHFYPRMEKLFHRINENNHRSSIRAINKGG